MSFDAPAYEVTANGSVTVGIQIDGDDRAPGDQPVASGLFSFGVRINWPSAQSELEPGSLDVTAALDYSGLIPSAKVEFGAGFADVRGNVALTSGAVVPYNGTTLLTIRLRNLAPSGTRIALGLASVRTDATQQIFLDAQGRPLDDAISFGRAQVSVVQEPALIPPRLLIRPLPPDTMELSFTVEKGRDHFIEVSDDLRTWSDLFPVPRNDGRIVVPASSRARYFRLRTTVAQ